MKLSLRTWALRSATSPAPLPLPLSARRYYRYATNTASKSGPESSQRRAVTPFNDDGHVPWSELSIAEKGSRAAQQSFNLGMVVVGVVLTGGVGYFLFSEVFSTDSKVAYFNRAVDRIKQDRRCLDLLGDREKITAFGEETGNKWRRARPLAATATKDRDGNDHLVMHFNIEGPKAAGVVNLHLIKKVGANEYAYDYFFLEVPGHPRLYLERSTSSSGRGSSGGGHKGFKMLGVKWS